MTCILINFIWTHFQQSSTVVRSLSLHRLKHIGLGRIVGCCCCLSTIDGRLSHMSPLIRKMAVSRLALGRKRRTMVGSLVEGMMGKMGMMGTVCVYRLIWFRLG